jgi:hypothetical protein
MAKFIRVVVAVLCALCVLAICIAPLADLPDTNLRSYHLAILLLFSLLAGATVVSAQAFKSATPTTRIPLIHPEQKKHHQLSPIDTNSILRY